MFDFAREATKAAYIARLTLKGVRKMMKDLITPAVLGLFLAFGAIFGVDAEIARQDRADGLEVAGCLFAVNCWQAGER